MLLMMITHAWLDELIDYAERGDKQGGIEFCKHLNVSEDRRVIEEMECITVLASLTSDEDVCEEIVAIARANGWCYDVNYIINHRCTDTRCSEEECRYYSLTVGSYLDECRQRANDSVLSQPIRVCPILSILTIPLWRRKRENT